MFRHCTWNSLWGKYNFSLGKQWWRKRIVSDISRFYWFGFKLLMILQNAATHLPHSLVCMNISISPGLSCLTMRNANLLSLPRRLALWQLRLYVFLLISSHKLASLNWSQVIYMNLQWGQNLNADNYRGEKSLKYPLLPNTASLIFLGERNNQSREQGKSIQIILRIPNVNVKCDIPIILIVAYSLIHEVSDLEIALPADFQGNMISIQCNAVTGIDKILSRTLTYNK